MNAIRNENHASSLDDWGMVSERPRGPPIWCKNISRISHYLCYSLSMLFCGIILGNVVIWDCLKFKFIFVKMILDSWPSLFGHRRHFAKTKILTLISMGLTSFFVHISWMKASFTSLNHFHPVGSCIPWLGIVQRSAVLYSTGIALWY